MLGRTQAMVDAGMTQEDHKNLSRAFPDLTAKELLDVYLETCEEDDEIAVEDIKANCHCGANQDGSRFFQDHGECQHCVNGIAVEDRAYYDPTDDPAFIQFCLDHDLD